MRPNTMNRAAVQLHLDTGIALFKERKYQGALVFFDLYRACSAVTDQGKCLAYYYTGRIYFNLAADAAEPQTEYRKALAFLNKACRAAFEQISPEEQCSALYYLGLSHFHLGDYAKAISFFARSLEPENGHEEEGPNASDEQITSAMLYLGAASYHTGKFEDAVAFLQSVLETEPTAEKRYIALYYIGSAKYCLKEYSFSIDYFQQALALQPDNLEIHKTIASAYYQTDKFAEAAASFEKVLSHYPTDTQSLFYKALSHYRLDQFAVSLRFFSSIVKSGDTSEPYGCNAIHYCGMACFNLGTYDDAIRCFEAVLKIKENSILDLYYAGRACYQKGEYAKAIHYFDQLRNLPFHPEHIEEQRQASDYRKLAQEQICEQKRAEGKAAFEQENYQAALECFNHVTKTDRTTFGDLQYLGAIKLRLAQSASVEKAFQYYAEAVRHLSQIVKEEEFEEDIFTLKNLGDAHYGLGQYGKAAEDYVKALGFKKDDFESLKKYCMAPYVSEDKLPSLQQYAKTLVELGQYKKAILIFEKVLSAMRGTAADEEIQVYAQFKKAAEEKRAAFDVQLTELGRGASVFGFPEKTSDVLRAFQEIDKKFQLMEVNLPTEFAVQFYYLQEEWLKRCGQLLAIHEPEAPVEEQVQKLKWKDSLRQRARQAHEYYLKAYRRDDRFLKLEEKDKTALNGELWVAERKLMRSPPRPEPRRQGVGLSPQSPSLQRRAAVSPNLKQGLKEEGHMRPAVLNVDLPPPPAAMTADLLEQQNPAAAVENLFIENNLSSTVTSGLFALSPDAETPTFNRFIYVNSGTGPAAPVSETRVYSGSATMPHQAVREQEMRNDGSRTASASSSGLFGRGWRRRSSIMELPIDSATVNPLHVGNAAGNH